MSRELSHIFQATVLLTCVTTAIYFFGRFDLSTVSPKQYEQFCGTEMPGGNYSGNSLAWKGKSLFQANCASCHPLFKDATGPSLIGYEVRSNLGNPEKFLAWLRDPSAYMKKDKYTRELFKRYGTMMSAFPEMTREEADMIAAYLRSF